MDIWYAFTKFFTQTYRNLLIPGLHISGEENLIEGPKIVVANHCFASDAFVIPSIFKDRLHFLFEEELVHFPFLGKLLLLSEQIPVIAGKGREALAAACDKLQEGHSIVIFPEGRLSNGKEIQRAQTGAIRLALASGCPLVPLGIYTPPKFVKMFRGRLANRPAIGSWQLGGSCYVMIGKAWNLSLEMQKFQQHPGVRAIHQATEELRDHLANLVDKAADLSRNLSFE